MLSLRSLACALVLLAGCQVASSRTSRQCEARVERLVGKLAQSEPPTTIVAVPALPGFEAPTVDAAASTELAASALELVLDARGDAELNGRSIRDADSLLGDLRSLRARWSLLHPAEAPPRVLHVWAHARLPMHRVMPWLAPATSLGMSVRLLARAPLAGPVRALQQQCPASLGLLCSTLDPSMPSSQAQMAYEALTHAMGTCRPLLRDTGRIGSLSVHERARRLRDVSPGALRDCDCGRGIDVEAFEYLAMIVSGIAVPRVVAVEWQDGAASDHETVAAWISRGVAR